MDKRTKDEAVDGMSQKHTADEEVLRALEWALGEIDALANRACQWAYPQAMRMLDREDQVESYVNACEVRRDIAARAALSKARAS